VCAVCRGVSSLQRFSHKPARPQAEFESKGLHLHLLAFCPDLQPAGRVRRVTTGTVVHLNEANCMHGSSWCTILGIGMSLCNH
jgi:hypothetical protein